MKDISDRHQDFALMSDLYTKESKSQTLSRAVPMWFNPARQSPASLPELALKWHCTAHAAGAYSPELERPTCRAEGPVPPVSHSHPLVHQITGGEGMWWGWRTGAEGPPPAHAWGARPALPALGPAHRQRFLQGHNHPVVIVPPLPAPSKGMANISSATGTSLALLRTCKQVAIVLGCTGIQNSHPFPLSTPAWPGHAPPKHFSITSVITARAVKCQSNTGRLGMEEAGKGHWWWDRQGWNRLKGRQEHRSVSLKRIGRSVPSCTFPVGRDLASHCSCPLPCRAHCCSRLLISPVTDSCCTSATQVPQVHAMAQRLILSPCARSLWHNL